jgi:predicted aconitase with swiveling domain
MAEARTLVPGVGEGEVLVLDEPLGFWGGIDPASGEVIDAHHPQRGANVSGKVLVMPSGRGSSSSSSILAEAVRAGTAPAAIVLLEADPIVALGAIVARELYGRTVPVVVADGVPGEAVRVVGDDATVLIEPSERSAGEGPSRERAGNAEGTP